MADKKRRAVGAVSKPVIRQDSTRAVWLLITGVGLLPLTLLVLLALIVILVVLLAVLGSSQSTSPEPGMSGPGDWITELAGGDGQGRFSGANVPDQKLVEPIADAGEQCGLLSPVILAAQIEYASGFDAAKEGTGGRKGLSQLTPEVFNEFGEDDDENGEVSVLDAEDSIYAHARYFCHLADEMKKLMDAKKVVGDHLTLTLMAWDIGLEAVEALGGMPFIDLDSYPYVIRGHFARHTADGDASSSRAPTGSPSSTASAARARTGAGSTTAHTAATGGAGYGEVIRSINGTLECGGGQPEKVRRTGSPYTNGSPPCSASNPRKGNLPC